MFYKSDFNLRKYNKNKVKHDTFTVILRNEKTPRKKRSKHSIIVAARPLMYFASVFGIQILGCSNRNTLTVNIFNRIYALTLISIIVLLIVFVKPANWDDTLKDIPLKFLNISQGIQETLEIVFFIFITSFRNNEEYVKLFKILNDIDDHFNLSKKIFTRRRITSLILIIIPIVQLSLTFWIRSFSVHNLVSHLIFFLLMVQGAICAFFLINVYSYTILFNSLLLKKMHQIVPTKQIAFRMTIRNISEKILTDETNRRSSKNVCWFELMQIYDKIADSMFCFNRIYNEQVLNMFISWFMTTLLIICRILSPTVQYSDVIVSELLLYFLINGRPLFLTKMGENLDMERQKIISIMLRIKIHQTYGNYNNYEDQVQLMIDLVEIRKMEISTNVFSVNFSVMVNFTGRVISYAVLMIQYFYLYIHENI